MSSIAKGRLRPKGFRRIADLFVEANALKVPPDTTWMVDTNPGDVFQRVWYQQTLDGITSWPVNVHDANWGTKLQLILNSKLLLALIIQFNMIFFPKKKCNISEM